MSLKGSQEVHRVAVKTKAIEVMVTRRSRTGRGKAFGLCAAACTALGSAVCLAALALPNTGWALGALGEEAPSNITASLTQFTPSNVDPALAARVARTIAEKGLSLHFTPASAARSRGVSGARTLTVAVRFDQQTTNAIAIRPSKGVVTQSKMGGGIAAIAPTRYNLGAAQGIQKFSQAPAALAGVKRAEFPDLTEFKPSDNRAPRKPSRFQPRIALEAERAPGRAPRTLESNGEQSVDVGGAYRVTRNLDVTAGVRLSQDRDRVAPLTDTQQDQQAVYVGTQFRF